MRKTGKINTWSNIKVSANGQFTFPKDARLALDPAHSGEKERQVFVISMLTPAKCLVCLNKAEFEEIQMMLDEEGEEDELRRISRASFEVETDDQGRIVVPSTLRQIFPLGELISISPMGSTRYEISPIVDSDEYYREEYTTEKLKNMNSTINALKKKRASNKQQAQNETK